MGDADCACRTIFAGNCLLVDHGHIIHFIFLGFKHWGEFMIKKEKQPAIVTLLITGLTFGILCLAAWFHTPNQISVSERRRLAQLPALTKVSVGKGKIYEWL